MLDTYSTRYSLLLYYTSSWQNLASDYLIFAATSNTGSRDRNARDTLRYLVSRHITEDGYWRASFQAGQGSCSSNRRAAVSKRRTSASGLRKSPLAVSHCDLYCDDSGFSFLATPADSLAIPEPPNQSCMEYPQAKRLGCWWSSNEKAKNLKSQTMRCNKMAHESRPIFGVGCMLDISAGCWFPMTTSNAEEYYDCSEVISDLCKLSGSRQPSYSATYHLKAEEHKKRIQSPPRI